MNHIVASFLFLVVSFAGFYGQPLLWNQSIDFGIVSNSSENFVDVPIKNISEKVIFLFRLDVDKRYQILLSNKKIDPDSTVFVRISFAPKNKGFFKEKINVHFSCFNQPKELEITGFAKEPILSSVDCPSFKTIPSSYLLNIDLTCAIKNKETGQMLSDFKLTLLNKGIPIFDRHKQKMGVFKKEIPTGLYYVIIEKEGFMNFEKLCYVNRKNNSFTFSLIPVENSKADTPNSLSNLNNMVSNNFGEDSTTYINQTDTFDKEIFSKENYLANNIVFLLDISTSMKYNGKLELLKASMLELVQLIRPIDKVTIVGYSSSANLLLSTTNGNNKDTLRATISGLKTKGLTDGGEGLKLACKMAMEEFILKGNNQVIIATDGDFNKGEENVNRIAKRYNKNGVKISVVGIKTKGETEKNMLVLTKNGGGNFIPVNSYESATFSLVNEIKMNSFKGFEK